MSWLSFTGRVFKVILELDQFHAGESITFQPSYFPRNGARKSCLYLDHENICLSLHMHFVTVPRQVLYHLGITYTATKILNILHFKCA